MDPNSLRGSQIGVFVGSIASEAHEMYNAVLDKISAYHLTGGAGAMLANRLSFFFDFKGNLPYRISLL